MARHSKWHNIRVHKGVQDRARGKVFTIHAKLIALAAQHGPDPDKNPALAEAILSAKGDNVPADNIERAIRRGSGLDKDAAEIMEIYYEGYGVSGIGIIARALTDNRNRTSANLRHIFSKHSGNLGETGSVSSFAFRYVGTCTVELGARSVEALEEILIESPALDYSDSGDGTMRITTEKQDLHATLDYLKRYGIVVREFGLEYLPTNRIVVSDFDKAVKILTLLENLEEDDDVEMVWTNADIPDILADEVHEAMEKKSFHT